MGIAPDTGDQKLRDYGEFLRQHFAMNVGTSEPSALHRVSLAASVPSTEEPCWPMLAPYGARAAVSMAVAWEHLGGLLSSTGAPGGDLTADVRCATANIVTRSPGEPETRHGVALGEPELMPVPVRIDPLREGAGWATPVARLPISLLKGSDLRAQAAALAQQATELLARQTPVFAEAVHPSFQRFLFEALQNIADHSGLPANSAAMLAFSLLPVSDSTIARASSNGEREWLERLGVGEADFEIAIGDPGRGVPAALAAAFSREKPEQAERLAQQVVAGSLRALESLQCAICRWAFHHKSTSRKEPIRDVSARHLTWRGLHHVLHAAWRLSGKVQLHSGIGVAGFAFAGGNAFELTPCSAPALPLPGTVISLRLRLGTRASLRSSTAAKATAESNIEFSRPVIATDRLALQALAECPPGDTVFSLIVHPFGADREEFVATWARRWSELPPHIVPVHLFSDYVGATELLGPLLFDTAEPIGGPPRLIGVAGDDLRVHWHFLGEVPLNAASALQQLSASGAVRCSEEDPEWPFYRDVLFSYPAMLRRQGEEITFSKAGAIIPSETYRESLQLAFDALLASNAAAGFILDSPDTLVRLPTGRIVQSYFSVLRLLDDEPRLETALSAALRTRLRELEEKHGSISVVTDTPASYWIVKRLLKSSIDVDIRSDPSDLTEAGFVVLIADLVYRGETIGRLCQSLPSSHLAIALVALQSGAGEPRGLSRIESLLHVAFDPGEVSEPQQGTASPKVLECDAVTHLAFEPAAPGTLLLGSTARSDAFLRRNAPVLRLGYRWHGDRLFTLGVDVRRAIDRYGDEVVTLLQQTILSILGRDAADEIVFVTRQDALVTRLLHALSRALLRSRRAGRSRFRACFRAELPVAPVHSREVFGRVAAGLLTNVTRVDVSFPFPERPSPGFACVFLDDRSVTGRTLRDFLLRVARSKADECPSIAAAIPIESRLSPSEQALFEELLQNLSCTTRDAPSVPFRYRPLFRVPVRTYSSEAELEVVSRLHGLERVVESLPVEALECLRRANERVPSRQQRSRSDEKKSEHRSPVFQDSTTDASSISYATARVRVLLSYQGQNIGALSALLDEISSTIAAHDVALLRMFALEPDLLQAPAVQNECWHDIGQLALHTLKTAGVDSPSAFDALTVLWLQGEVFDSQLLPIVASLGRHPKLVPLFLVFVGERLSSAPGTFPSRMRRTVSCLSTWPAETRALVEEILRHPPSNAGLAASGADGAAETLVAILERAAYHGPLWERLKLISDWAARPLEERAGTSTAIVGARIRDAVEVLLGEALPALDSCAALARARSERDAAADLRRCAQDLRRRALALAREADAISTETVGPSKADRLVRAWRDIEDASFRVSADRFLTKPLHELAAVEETDRAALPALERHVQSLLCSPLDVFCQLTFMKLDSAGFTPGSLYLCTCARDALEDILRLLLNDISKHAIPGTVTAQARLLDRGQLLLRLSNRYPRERRRGRGLSQERVRQVAGRQGIYVTFREVDGDTYLSELQFSKTYVIDAEEGKVR